MAVIGSQFGNLPGMGNVVETFEQAFTWGPYPRYFTGAYLSSLCADTGNSPTWELRPGLLLGKILSSGQWTNYSPTANDGSQVPAGVLIQGIRMQDIFSGNNTAKFFGIMVSGGVQASKLLGLDLYARSVMRNFYFDDNLPGNSWFDWQRFFSKTANYQVLASDNFTLFDNTGAAGEVDFTLPPIANGYKFGFRCNADQTVKVFSTEGANMVAFNNAVANSVAFSTGGARVGGQFTIISNPAGTKWYVLNESSGANTVTVA